MIFRQCQIQEKSKGQTPPRSLGEMGLQQRLDFGLPIPRTVNDGSELIKSMLVIALSQQPWKMNTHYPEQSKDPMQTPPNSKSWLVKMQKLIKSIQNCEGDQRRKIGRESVMANLDCLNLTRCRINYKTSLRIHKEFSRLCQLKWEGPSQIQAAPSGGGPDREV